MTSEDDPLDVLQGTTHFICANGHVVRVDSDPFGDWWRHTVSGEWLESCGVKPTGDAWQPIDSLLAFEVYDDE